MQSLHKTREKNNILPACATEYIKLVVRKMRYRRKVRQDVQTELAAHFEDELKDCRTDQEKEQKAQQLIAEFGDVKLLAILLRRAKKRCRPLWRTVVARTFQAMGVLILCFIIYAVWFSTGRPTISIDYLALLNQMNRPEVLDEDNAWPHYKKAMELYVGPDQRILQLTWRTRRQLKRFKRRLCFSDLEKDKQDKINEWLKENESFWENLNLPQKGLIGKCFKEGLVPLPYPSYIAKPPSGQYEAFDVAVEVILKRIERQPENGWLEHSSEYEYRMMMEMEIQAWPKCLRGDSDLVPDAALDSEVIAWLGAHSREELKNMARGIEAGAVKEWINSPPVIAES